MRGRQLADEERRRIDEIVALIANRDHAGFLRLPHVQCAEPHSLFYGVYDFDIEAIHAPARNIIVEERKVHPSLVVTAELEAEGVLDSLRLILYIDTRSKSYTIIVDGLTP